MISQKKTLNDYTYAEFHAVVAELLQADGTSAWQDRLLEHFITITEHPAGSDLLYYPADQQMGSAEDILAHIMMWRRAMNRPLFREA